jgi:hypothetical protein
MHTEDQLTFLASHLDSPFDADQSSEPSPTSNGPVFPAELLDSGFEWTNILTG